MGTGIKDLLLLSLRPFLKHSHLFYPPLVGQTKQQLLLLPMILLHTSISTLLKVRFQSIPLYPKVTTIILTAQLPTQPMICLSLSLIPKRSNFSEIGGRKLKKTGQSLKNYLFNGSMKLLNN